eukprot:351385-Chlamydomonas_euryale.AAC.4
MRACVHEGRIMRECRPWTRSRSRSRSRLFNVAQHPHMPERGEMRQPNPGRLLSVLSKVGVKRTMLQGISIFGQQHEGSSMRAAARGQQQEERSVRVCSLLLSQRRAVII